MQCEESVELTCMSQHMDPVRFPLNAILMTLPGSVVGIATAYGLDGPGIESRWGQDFSHLSRPTLRPTQPV